MRCQAKREVAGLLGSAPVFAQDFGARAPVILAQGLQPWDEVGVGSM